MTEVQAAWTLQRAAASLPDDDPAQPLVRFFIAVRDCYPTAEEVVLREGPRATAVAAILAHGESIADWETLDPHCEGLFNFRDNATRWWKEYAGEPKHRANHHRLWSDAIADGGASQLYRIHIDSLARAIVTPSPPSPKPWAPNHVGPSLFSSRPLD